MLPDFQSRIILDRTNPKISAANIPVIFLLVFSLIPCKPTPLFYLLRQDSRVTHNRFWPLIALRKPVKSTKCPGFCVNSH